ncbi:hypothetical protein FACS189485_23280 [Spirochaetia bacterium]|nr:hypothetical protein FACS189485_23280 [Spirochaetia bacterium]
MITVNQYSIKILNKLWELAAANDGYCKLDNAHGIFTPLVIERIKQDQLSLCHYGKMHGGLMRDPEMVFLRGDDQHWYPICFRADYVGKEILAITITGTTIKYDEKLQADQVPMAELWIRSLAVQQNLKEADHAG